jgi:hypothetical protein
LDEIVEQAINLAEIDLKIQNRKKESNSNIQ